MDAVQEIKSRLNIEDVISQYVQLKRAGRNFRGLSPWTNEKTPSFMVSPEKQIWHDFSSGKGGDVLTFVMEMEGLDFKSALELLARQAGVDLAEFRGDSDGQRSKLKNRVLAALELAAKFYQKQLTANQPALKYLVKDRGFSKQTLLDWRLGYAPHTAHALADFLTKQGYTTEEMKAAGLVTMRVDGPFDMFRGRIMIPLADSRGTIIGFTARLLEDEPNAPKYINTPQTIVYDKSRHVFGLHLSKEAIRKTGIVVIAEGNLDVISAHQVGTANVVASAGTAMTDKHLKELKRFTADIRLSFDTDSAGLTATERAIGLAQKVGVDLRVIDLAGAKDPDELARRDPKAWRTAIDNALYSVDWLMDRYAKELDLASAPGKRNFTTIVLAVIRHLQDPVEQEHYLKKVAQLTDSTLEAVEAKFFRQTPEDDYPRRRYKPQPKVDGSEMQEYRKLQDQLLAITLSIPSLRVELDDLYPEYFSDGPPRRVFNFLKAHPDFKGEAQTAKPLQEVYDYVKILSLQFEELYQPMAAEDQRDQAGQLKRRLIMRYAKIKKEELALAMNATDDEQELKKLIDKANKLNELIKAA